LSNGKAISYGKALTAEKVVKILLKDRSEEADSKWKRW